MERRTALRHQVWLPVNVDGVVGGVAVTHDVSGSGVLIATASALEVGAVVTVKLRLPPDGELEHIARGHVVRVEPNRADPHGLWRHRIAVEFDDPIPELETALDAVRLPE